MKPVLKDWGFPNGFANKYVIILLLLFCLLIPLSFLRNMATLAKFSAVAVVSELVLVVGLMVRAADPVRRPEVKFESAKFIALDGSGFFSALPFFAYAFACTSVVHHIYAELKDPTPARMTQVGMVSLSICATAYGIAAVCGYVAFGKHVDADVLNSFTDGDDLGTVIRLCVMVAVSLTYPLQMYPTRNAMCSCYRHFKDAPPIKSGRFLHYTELPFHCTVILIVCSWAIAYAVSGIEIVMGFIGSHVGCMLLVIAPNALYLGHLHRAKDAGTAVMRQRYEKYKKFENISKGVIILGVILWFISIIDFYVGLSESSDDSANILPVTNTTN